MVAKWLGFKKPVFSGRSGMRGCADYKGSHGFEPKFLAFSGKAFDVVSALVMIRLFIGFSLGLPPAKAINDPFLSKKKNCFLRWPNENYLIILGH